MVPIKFSIGCWFQRSLFHIGREAGKGEVAWADAIACAFEPKRAFMSRLKCEGRPVQWPSSCIAVAAYSGAPRNALSGGRETKSSSREVRASIRIEGRHHEVPK